MKATEILVTMV